MTIILTCTDSNMLHNVTALAMLSVAGACTLYAGEEEWLGIIIRPK